MADGLSELLSVKEWLPAHAAQVGYTTAPATETLASPPTDNALRYRFVMVVAVDGDLLVEIGNNDNANQLPATPNTGSLRVFSRTVAIFQLKAGGLAPSLKVAAVSGTVNGAILWGR